MTAVYTQKLKGSQSSFSLPAVLEPGGRVGGCIYRPNGIVLVDLCCWRDRRLHLYFEYIAFGCKFTYSTVCNGRPTKRAIVDRARQFSRACETAAGLAADGDRRWRRWLREYCAGLR